MATIREHAAKYLEGRGLWPDEAHAVVLKAEQSQILEGMTARWDEATDCYPPMLMRVVEVSLDAVAVEWIDANKPRHFARAMFAGVTV